MQLQPYISPEIDVVKLPVEDLITVSDPFDDGKWTIVV